jgi:hypothetical protein
MEAGVCPDVKVLHSPTHICALLANMPSSVSLDSGYVCTVVAQHIYLSFKLSDLLPNCPHSSQEQHPPNEFKVEVGFKSGIFS